MACRMLIAAGRLPLRDLLEDFKLMALNQNERHEHSDRPDHTNGDGWGVVTGRAGRLECYKSIMPCWQDPRFRDLYQADLDFVMLHARKASPGMAVSYAFTHPFLKDGWYFCHNGTIHDFLVNESSDAQQLFALVLDKAGQSADMREAIGATVRSLREYSALNFILFNGDLIYVLNMYGKQGEKTPDYFTMKYLQASDYTIIASERLPSCGQEWQEAQNATLLMLTTSRRKIEVRRV